MLSWTCKQSWSDAHATDAHISPKQYDRPLCQNCAVPVAHDASKAEVLKALVGDHSDLSMLLLGAGQPTCIVFCVKVVVVVCLFILGVQEHLRAVLQEWRVLGAGRRARLLVVDLSRAQVVWCRRLCSC